MNLLRDIFFYLFDNFFSSFIIKKYLILNNKIIILTFHRIKDEPDTLWPPMHIDNFEKIIEFLSLETLVMPLSSLSKIKRYPKKPVVCLSFDDGYIDFIDNALPVLTKYNLPCNHNICPGLIDKNILPWTQILNIYLKHNVGKKCLLPDGSEKILYSNFSEKYYIKVLDMCYCLKFNDFISYINYIKNKTTINYSERLMGWNDIRDCVRNDVEIGSHSSWHHNLAMIDEKNILINDILYSRKRIYDEVGVNTKIFAFPSGKYNTKIIKILRDLDFKIILLCEEKTNKVDFNSYSEFAVYSRINLGIRSVCEEKMRSLGVHEKLKRKFFTA